jgi:hypothetical protein
MLDILVREPLGGFRFPQPGVTSVTASPFSNA